MSYCASKNMCQGGRYEIKVPQKIYHFIYIVIGMFFYKYWGILYACDLGQSYC